MIVYEILTHDEPFKNFNQFQILSEIVYKKNRPILGDSISVAYKKLIESCWKDDPNERPSFDQIVEELRNNEGFITDDVEKEDFLEYIDYIDHYESTFNSLQTNYFPGSSRKSHAFQQVSINQIKMKINEVEDKIKEENNDILKGGNDSESKEENNDILKGENDSESKEDNELKDKKIIKNEDEKPTIIKSFFNLFTKNSDQVVIKYPVDEFNKLDKKCQKLITEANEDRDVQFIVGRSLIRGENEFPLNIEMGIKYLEKSISNECIDSVLYYSRMLIKGDIIPKDIDKAKKYLQKFFKENNGRIFHLYAKIVYNEKNFSEAKKYFEKSAKLGNVESMYRIAKMLFKGEGVKMNKIEALKYFDMSNRIGYEKSKKFLYVNDQLNKIDSFEKLHGETQEFFISQIIKSSTFNLEEKNIKLKDIYIPSDKTQMMFFNNSFKSQHFVDFLRKYESISIELQYTSRSFDSQLNLIFKIKTENIRKINVIVFISGIKKLTYKFGVNKAINKITIEPTLNIIGSFAFSGCQTLREITIPSSVTTIGVSSFDGCSFLTEIIIPSSVTSIGASSFKNCSSLYEIKLPPSITTIEKETFYDCSFLTKITIPTSLTLIEESAFNGCKSLVEITIPSSVTSIGSYAFYGCSSLKKITLSSYITSMGEGVFRLCSSLEEISIPCYLSYISNYLFYSCTSLKKIFIPSSINSIGEFAFFRCSDLKEIAIPSSVVSINDNAFYECSSLQDLVVPSSVSSIGERAFYRCSSLKKISIHSPEIKIDKSAFDCCESLEEYVIPSQIHATVS